MLELRLNLPEVAEFVKMIPNSKEKLLELMRYDLKQNATDFVNSVLSCELDLFLGRGKYERQETTSRNLRNGHYLRRFGVKGLGKIEVRIPRDRKGLFKTQILPKYERIEGQLKEDMAMLYIMGLSTRNFSLVSERLFGYRVSHEQVSNCAAKLSEGVEKWRTRRITTPFKYLYLDGTNFKMRIGKQVELVNVLVVIGVGEDNVKQVLALQAGDKESASSWREVFKDLKSRGLQKEKVLLGIMDGLPGLESVFEDEFPNGKVQRCQVHVARNVLCKVPQKKKKEIADGMRSVFYASSRKKADELFKEFKSKHEKTLPSAVKCLESSLSSTLRFFDFPNEEWLALRTTNPIERVNKEFKRRTKSMEIVAGEQACYNLLAVVCLKFEAYWKRFPLTQGSHLLGLYEFTQKN